MGRGRRWEGGGGGTTAPSEGCSAEGTVMQRPTGGRKLSINPRIFRCFILFHLLIVFRKSRNENRNAAHQVLLI